MIYLYNVISNAVSVISLSMFSGNGRLGVVIQLTYRSSGAICIASYCVSGVRTYSAIHVGRTANLGFRYLCTTPDCHPSPLFPYRSRRVYVLCVGPRAPVKAIYWKVFVQAWIVICLTDTASSRISLTAIRSTSARSISIGDTHNQQHTLK